MIRIHLRSVDESSMIADERAAERLAVLVGLTRAGGDSLAVGGERA